MTRIEIPRHRVPRPPMPGELYEDYRLSRMDVDNHNLRIDNEDMQQTIKRQKQAIIALAAVALGLTVALVCTLALPGWR